MRRMLCRSYIMLNRQIFQLFNQRKITDTAVLIRSKHAWNHKQHYACAAHSFQGKKKSGGSFKGGLLMDWKTGWNWNRHTSRATLRRGVKQMFIVWSANKLPVIFVSRITLIAMNAFHSSNRCCLGGSGDSSKQVWLKRCGWKNN